MAERSHLSYSQLALYQSCPLRFYFQYIEGIKPSTVPATLAFGSSIHRVIAAHLQAQLEGTQRGLPELQAWFEKDWTEAQDREAITFTKADAGALMEQGKALLSVFVQGSSQPQGYQLCGIEEPFEVSLSGDLPPLRGQIDALYLSEDDPERLYIVDWKTASTAYAASKANHDHQLDAYALAMTQHGYPVGKMTVGFSVLVKTKEPKFQHVAAGRTSRQLERFSKVATKVYKAIQADIFFPKSDWHCSDCSYRRHCASW